MLRHWEEPHRRYYHTPETSWAATVDGLGVPDEVWKSLHGKPVDVASQTFRESEARPARGAQT